MNNYDFLVIPMLVFALFLDLFWKPFWLALKSIFEALGSKEVNKKVSNIYAEIGIEKRGSEEVPLRKRFLGWWPGGGTPLKADSPPPPLGSPQGTL